MKTKGMQLMSNLDYSLIRLTPESGQDIIEHICLLPDQDRYLRFGYSPLDSSIATYVNSNLISSDRQNNYWYGIKDDDKLIATIHIATFGDVAEFAFTTDVNYRGHKLGQLLFARGYQLVTEENINRIYLACLTENKVMRHIAKKFGLSVMTNGSDSEASINIQYPVPLSRLHEVKMCIIDKNLGGK